MYRSGHFKKNKNKNRNKKKKTIQKGGFIGIASEILLMILINQLKK